MSVFDVSLQIRDPSGTPAEADGAAGRFVPPTALPQPCSDARGRARTRLVVLDGTEQVPDEFSRRYVVYYGLGVV